MNSQYLNINHYITIQDLSGIHVNSNESSAVYCGLVNNKSELLYGIGDFDIHASIDVQFVSKVLH